MGSVGILMHDDVQGVALFVRIFKQCGEAKTNDTLVFHAPFTGIFIFHDLGIHIEFETHVLIFLQDIGFLPP